ncbi:O-antigen ligase family protein [Ferrimonas aestuarii]|uniref:O-antigen ligase family protein n=2 Tax=Ferrimonas aestuarii TaxID=2569539 RepID=A0A4V5NVU9_9GAMM|nr:O-antigen ligase family protein [Ferrimonas aestuarii]
MGYLKMFDSLLSRFVQADVREFTLNNRLAIVLITLVIASSFGVLTPDLEAAVELEDLELDQHASSTSSGNRFNQLFWITLMGISIFSILRDPMRFRRLIFNQWPLLLLIAVATTSVLWAIAPGIAFRRSILLICVATSIFTGICYLRSPYQIPLIVYRVGTLGLGLNILAIGLGSFDIEGYFYGIHGHKNVLGAVALMALFFGFAARAFNKSQINSLFNTLYLLGWFGILLISVSKTSIALFFLVPGLVFGAQFLARNFRINLGLLMLSTTLTLVGIVMIILLYSDLHIKQFLELFVADAGFTGRDFIWAFLLDQIDKHWYLGHGYGSFWGIGIHSPNIVYGRGFLTLLNQGHNGYLDLWAKLGILGISIYAIVLVQFSRQSGYIQDLYPGLFTLCWILLLLTLLHNITESSIMRGGHSLWVIQLLIIGLIARLAMDKEKYA